MKLVTLANIQFNRIGSLGSGGGGFQRTIVYGNDTRVIICAEVASSDPIDILTKVKEIALEKGEREVGLNHLQPERQYGSGGGQISFNEPFQPYGGVQYGSTYADCEVFPALAIDGRYFRLQEVQKTTL